MIVRIDRDELKQAVCESKKAGKPTEALGVLLVQLVTNVAGHFSDRRSGFPTTRSDSEAIVVLKCLQAASRIKCNHTSAKAFNFLSTVAINGFRRIYRDHYRRKAAWERFADDYARTSATGCT